MGGGGDWFLKGGRGWGLSEGSKLKGKSWFMLKRLDGGGDVCWSNKCEKWEVLDVKILKRIWCRKGGLKDTQECDWF